MAMSFKDLQASLDAERSVNVEPSQAEKNQKRLERKLSIKAGDGTLWAETDAKSAPGREFLRGSQRSGESSLSEKSLASEEDVESGQQRPAGPVILADPEQGHDPSRKLVKI